MNDAALVPKAFEAVDLEELLAQVATLCNSAAGPASDAGAPRPDPVRLVYIEALARRLQASSPVVQKVLHTKLAQALKALGGGIEAGTMVSQVRYTAENKANGAPSAGPGAVEGPAPNPAPRKSRPKAQSEAAPQSAPMSLLGQLNQHIQTASFPLGVADGSNGSRGLAHTGLRDLISAIRFRETWARISAETEVDEAIHRAPENAGPLNAHNLVLRTLNLMRDLSPDYLRRFLNHTESLMWLDQANGQLKRPTEAGRGRKTLKNR